MEWRGKGRAYPLPKKVNGAACGGMRLLIK